MPLAPKFIVKLGSQPPSAGWKELKIADGIIVSFGTLTNNVSLIPVAWSLLEISYNISSGIFPLLSISFSYSQTSKQSRNSASNILLPK